MKYGDLDYSTNRHRELGVPSNTLPAETFKEYYQSGNYETYLIEYYGDIISALDSIDYADVYITEKFFAILFVQRGMLNTLIENVGEITGIQRNFIYTLSELTINNDLTQTGSVYEGSIPLDGEGVIVGIIGTGIDYLNPRFMTETGQSRIVAIWDQTINTGTSPEIFPYGSEYRRENINEAINTALIGRSPYDIVPHRDEVGHGTAIAGLIGGRSQDVIPKFKSVAPKCEFAIVKLEEAKSYALESAGIAQSVKNVYQSTNISSAIRYLSDLQLKLKRPMVVCLPIGTNFGGRDGGTILERYIDNLTLRKDFCIITDTGDQGIGNTHSSGIIEATGQTAEILINIGETQSSLSITIYTRRPDIISISVTSPLGGTINRVPLPSINEQNKYLTFEESGINIEYFAQEGLTGSVSISMVIKNTVKGVWRISLFGDYIVSGLYDAWLLNSKLLSEDTRFLAPDPFTTLLTPCTAENILATSCYNGITNTIIESSGKGFPRVGVIKPSFAIEGTNLLTAGLNNSVVVGSGSSMASAILAGTVALVYQWSIVQGRLSSLSPPELKNLLIASTVKDESIIYPNREWGYGKLSINKLYEILVSISKDRGNTNDNIIARYPERKSSSYLYMNIPPELFIRVNK
ncbi:subtilisin family serine protease [Clostridium punense]|uniref:Subtilisin family serine protease n=1 Tax=Clostridium punense TaxID=1054297 RepID=A0ABS4K8E4_9CLOT|nr:MULTISPECIES: S8 family peptidase [Clostridium]EQB86814.1 hypothetical protein M918_12400 [Clostridium sp. BL8]MBP2024050.1 subtilisin family serine protease [Clostridium punense]